MIRVLGLLALFPFMAMFVACAGPRYVAAPAGQPQAGGASQGPEDPYAGDAVTAARESCSPGETCSFECAEGGCSYFCAEGSTCNVECNGGKCRLACGFNATCNLECDGGQCGTGCAAGATCHVECDGGSCAQACAPEASCSVECDGGNCG